MPKFFFNLTDKLSTVRDSTGQDLPDATAAREHASASMGAFSRRVAQFNGNEGLFWTVQVVDEHGQQIFTLQLVQPVPARPQTQH